MPPTDADFDQSPDYPDALGDAAKLLYSQGVRTTLFLILEAIEKGATVSEIRDTCERALAATETVQEEREDV